MIKVRFVCGHLTEVHENIQTAPICPDCGTAGIARVMARPPRFRGVATGPYCETVGLAPATVDLTGGKTLVLTPPKDLS